MVVSQFSNVVQLIFMTEAALQEFAALQAFDVISMGKSHT